MNNIFLKTLFIGSPLPQVTQTTVSQITSGQVINLASNDVQKLDYVYKMNNANLHILFKDQDL